VTDLLGHAVPVAGEDVVEQTAAMADEG